MAKDQQRNLAMYLVAGIIIIVLLYIFMSPKSQKSNNIVSYSLPSGYINAVISNASGDLSYIPSYDAFVPTGTIVMWSGGNTTPPQGWAFCDGKNGTPDLRARFILGSTYAGDNFTNLNDRGGDGPLNVGNTGGERNHTLTIAEMPSHDHQHDMYWSWSGNCTVGTTSFDCGGGSRSRSDVKIAPTGGSQPHNNIPPYYVLAFIVKL